MPRKALTSCVQTPKECSATQSPHVLCADTKGMYSTQSPHVLCADTQVVLLTGCLTSQQHTSQGRICSDNCTYCHTEIEVGDQTFHLTESQCTDTGPTSPEADPITPDAWQGSHRAPIVFVTGVTRPRKKTHTDCRNGT